MITISETTIGAQPVSNGITRKRLLTNESLQGTRLLLDRLTLKAGATLPINIPEKSLAWMQLLEGEATLSAYFTDRLSDSHSITLPPGYNAALSTDKGASLLYAEITDVGRVDSNFPANPPLFMVVNWRREPVFASEHDARKRISLVNTDLCGTAAIKIDMVIYPQGFKAPSYHHERTDTFIYLLSGRGTAWANEQPNPIQQGDVMYFPDREQHHLQAVREMRFLEFYVPGTFKTVWADPNKVSAWRSTGLDIDGQRTEHDERERIAYRYMYGNPFTR